MHGYASHRGQGDDPERNNVSGAGAPLEASSDGRSPGDDRPEKDRCHGEAVVRAVRLRQTEGRGANPGKRNPARDTGIRERSNHLAEKVPVIDGTVRIPGRLDVNR